MATDIVETLSRPYDQPANDVRDGSEKHVPATGTDRTLNATKRMQPQKARQVAERLSDIFAQPGWPGISEDRGSRETLHGHCSRHD